MKPRSSNAQGIAARWLQLGNEELNLRRVCKYRPYSRSCTPNEKLTPSRVRLDKIGADMKIYFGFTVAGNRSSLEAARKIVELLVQMGHEVLTRHLVRDDAWEADRRITPQEVYLRDMKWLEQCDLFMAEVSGSSFGLGFETGYLLGATDKKVVLFFRRDAEKTISLMITGIANSNCTVVPYSQVKELEAWVKNCLFR
jgi:nucleoside 2-deoxyribosyltransferase